MKYKGDSWCLVLITIFYLNVISTNKEIVQIWNFAKIKLRSFLDLAPSRHRAFHPASSLDSKQCSGKYSKSQSPGYLSVCGSHPPEWLQPPTEPHRGQGSSPQIVWRRSVGHLGKFQNHFSFLWNMEQL